MKIESGGEECIIVALSKEDLTEFDITYDEIDYKNIETRRVIWTVLDEAKSKLGRTLDLDGRLLIEVSPAENGGCVLCFTALPEGGEIKKRLVMKKDSEPMMLCADDENSFLSAFEILEKDSDNVSELSAYRSGENLYLMIIPKPQRSPYLTFRLSEYGDVCISEKEYISEIREHARLIYNKAQPISDSTAALRSEDAKI